MISRELDYLGVSHASFSISSAAKTVSVEGDFVNCRNLLLPTVRKVTIIFGGCFSNRPPRGSLKGGANCTHYT